MRACFFLARVYTLRVRACFMLARVSTPSSLVRERERERERKREGEKEKKRESEKNGEIYRGNCYFYF